MATFQIQFQKSLKNDERAQLICMVHTLATALGAGALFLPEPSQSTGMELASAAMDFLQTLSDTPTSTQRKRNLEYVTHREIPDAEMAQGGWFEVTSVKDPQDARVWIYTGFGRKNSEGEVDA